MIGDGPLLIHNLDFVAFRAQSVVVSGVPASDLVHFIFMRHLTAGDYRWDNLNQILLRALLFQRWTVEQSDSADWLLSLQDFVDSPALLGLLRHNRHSYYSLIGDLVLDCRRYLNALHPVGIHKTHLLK